MFVACNKASEIAEIDVDGWTLTRRIPAGDGVYNLAVSHDGKLLVATNKRGQSVSVFDAASGKELKRLPTKRKVVHGVAITPDDRYAFVSVEGVGSAARHRRGDRPARAGDRRDGRCRADGGRDRRLEVGLAR